MRDPFERRRSPARTGTIYLPLARTSGITVDTDAETHRTTVDGRSVAYRVRRSDRASRARIDVRLEGVRVVVPSGRELDPEALLRQEAEWLLEKLDSRAKRLEALPERQFEPGGSLPYLGTDRTIWVEQRSSSAVTDEALRLAEWEVERTSVRNVVETLYRRKARAFVESAIERYREQMGVEPERIRIADQRTRWGSCSNNGTLSYNWRLLLAPREVAEYVVVHELAHLVELNHSDRFWALVEEHDSEWRRHRAWLQENGDALLFDVQER